MFDYQQLKQNIIEIINQENGRPIPDWLIIKKLKLTNRADVVNQLLEELTKDKIVYQTKTGCYCLNKIVNIKPADLIEGLINVNYSQSGFITLPNEKKAKYFVQKQNLNGALDGDTVLFYANKQTDKPLIDAVVFKVVKHAKDYFVCVYDVIDNKHVIKPDNEKNYLEIILDQNEQIPLGSKILVKIDRFENNKAFGHLERIIGHKDDVGIDILSIVLDNGVEPSFPQNIIDDVQKMKIDIDEHQRAIRKDLTQLPIVTIDPTTSKDFDDAIYVKKMNDNNYLLSVSIADVSHYVAYQSPLDEIALSRGCSIYLVDRVIPMLPHKLSDDLCSLVPNVERLTLTCDTIINEQGKILDIKVYPSIIKSHRRFSYDQVNAFFNNHDALVNDSQEIKTMLLEALALHKILDNAKRLRGYIEFNVPKAVIKVDENCVPIEINKYQSGTAQHMIEDFMVIANEAVTRYAKQKKYPFIYRVHDKPNIDRLKTFAMEAKKLGFKITTDIETITSKDIAQWLVYNKDNKNLDLIDMMLLRSMAKAEYSINNIGHFGLSLIDYTHFTSPIRRYPDLIVHRIFWMYEFSKNTMNDNNRKHMASQLEEHASLSSKNELRAVACERAVEQMKFAEYLSFHIGEEYDGQVSSVSSFGIFVQLPNTIEGLIKIANLGDYYTYNATTNELVGKTKGIRFCVGSRVRVSVMVADKLTRKIEFSLIRFIGNR